MAGAAKIAIAYLCPETSAFVHVHLQKPIAVIGVLKIEPTCMWVAPETSKRAPYATIPACSLPKWFIPIGSYASNMAVNWPPAPLDPPPLLDELPDVPPSSPPPLLLELVEPLEVLEPPLLEPLLLEVLLLEPLELLVLPLLVLLLEPLLLEVLEPLELLEPVPFPVPVLLSEEHATIETPAAAKKHTPNRIAFMSGLLDGSSGERVDFTICPMQRNAIQQDERTATTLFEPRGNEATTIFAGGRSPLDRSAERAIAHERATVQWTARMATIVVM
jgi:hypothetical protein